MKDSTLVYLLIGGGLAVSFLAKPINEVLSAPVRALNLPLNVISSVKTGVQTPGGILGKNSATDIGFQTANIASSGTTIFNDIQTGISNPGGILGKESLTDVGYQFNKIFGGLF